MAASTAPSRPTIDVESIPQELKDRQQWVCWRFLTRDGKRTKVPHVSKVLAAGQTAEQASSTDPETWRGFAQALTAFERGGYDGIGFVFAADDPYVGVDLDKCLSDGRLEPWAEEIVRDLDTYCEISPSGTGVKLWVRAALPAAGRRKGRLEMYEVARFFTTTGRRLPGTPAVIAERSAELLEIHRRIFGERREQTSEPRAPRQPVDLDDRELLRRMFNAKNGGAIAALWRGDTSAYGGDHSAADMALVSHLCFWCNGDEGRVDRLFRDSGLMREKWDQRRGPTTYGTRTINAAMRGFHEGYQPGGPELSSAGRPAGEPGAPADSADDHQADDAPGTETAAEQQAAGADDERRAGARPRRDVSGEPSAPGERPLSDLGNAERLVDRHGLDLAWCAALGWLVWSGTHWMRDEIAVARLAAETVRAIYREAELADTKQEASRLAGWAVSSESAARLAAMTELARPMVAVSVDVFDTDPWLLACQNGTVDLRTGELREHRREDRITGLVDVRYMPGADCPRWRAFFERVLPDPDVRSFVQRAAGYSATGSARERKLLVCWGQGRNGKSVFARTLRDVLGPYAQVTPPTILQPRAPGAVPNDIAALRGVRLAVMSETGDGARLDEAIVKSLTGDEPISARFMRQDFFEYRPRFTPWLLTNHRPRIGGTDAAIWDRLCLIPWTVRIPDEEVDPTLGDKLLAERQGILAWLVAGAVEWYRAGLRPPAAVLAATAEYRQSEDRLADFLADRCHIAADAWVEAGALYREYAAWCTEAGEKPWCQTRFGNRLTERGFPAERRRLPGGSVARIRVGIGLLGPSSPQEPAPEPPDGPSEPSTQAREADLLTGWGSVTGCDANSGINGQMHSAREVYPENGVNTSTPVTDAAWSEEPADDGLDWSDDTDPLPWD